MYNFDTERNHIFNQLNFVLKLNFNLQIALNC